MFDAAQEAEMQEAQAKMMEFEKQLAEMPPDQRRMMEGMMGSQLETMRAMAAGGGFQSEMTVTSITVNPPAVNTDGTPCPSGSVGQSPPAPAAAAAVGAAASAAPVASDPAALRTAQEACLQQKVDEAQATQKTKRGIGSLISGVSRAASRFGGGDIAGDISRTAGDIYAADATAKDFAQAAKDLGLSESDIEACQSPQ
ncbi:MAG TPA: hypothetical protein VFY03_09100, partial [Woeseiaceae bacterium]|nr:hypothetical protein [Woeseiaceae bacterium]